MNISILNGKGGQLTKKQKEILKRLGISDEEEAEKKRNVFFNDIIELTKPLNAILHIGYSDPVSDAKNIPLKAGTRLQVSPYSSLENEITFRAMSPFKEEILNEYIDISSPHYQGFSLKIKATELSDSFTVVEKFDVANLDMKKAEDHPVFLHLFFENNVPSHLKIDESIIGKLNVQKENYENGQITSNEVMNQSLEILKLRYASNEERWVHEIRT